MCRCNGKAVDHLSHCDVAYALWSFTFRDFGIQWVLPKWVVDLLFGYLHSLDIGTLVPLCLMWTLWRERNSRTFEDAMCSTIRLESLLIRTLYDWSRVWVATPF
jgi:hypothetical protein